MPGVKFEKPCLECKQPLTCDMGSEHLSYPTANSETNVYFYCRSCDKGYRAEAYLTVSLELTGELTPD